MKITCTMTIYFSTLFKLQWQPSCFIGQQFCSLLNLCGPYSWLTFVPFLHLSEKCKLQKKHCQYLSWFLFLCVLLNHCLYHLAYCMVEEVGFLSGCMTFSQMFVLHSGLCWICANCKISLWGSNAQFFSVLNYWFIF